MYRFYLYKDSNHGSDANISSLPENFGDIFVGIEIEKAITIASYYQAPMACLSQMFQS